MISGAAPDSQRESASLRRHQHNFPRSVASGGPVACSERFSLNRIYLNPNPLTPGARSARRGSPPIACNRRVAHDPELPMPVSGLRNLKCAALPPPCSADELPPQIFPPLCLHQSLPIALAREDAQ